MSHSKNLKNTQILNYWKTNFRIKIYSISKSNKVFELSHNEFRTLILPKNYLAKLLFFVYINYKKLKRKLKSNFFSIPSNKELKIYLFCVLKSWNIEIKPFQFAHQNFSQQKIQFRQKIIMQRLLLFVYINSKKKTFASNFSFISSNEMLKNYLFCALKSWKFLKLFLNFKIQQSVQIITQQIQKSSSKFSFFLYTKN